MVYMKLKKAYDVIIVGAGPAGSTTAAFLGKRGHEVLLIDKAKFPRDKTCGDAISGSLRTQESLGLTPIIKEHPHAEIRRAFFSSPNGNTLAIEFKGVGYCCRRYIYDNLIFQKGKEQASVIEEFMVTGLLTEDGYVCGVRGKDKNGKEHSIKAKVVVGADGAHSVVARDTGCLDLDPEHTITAVRCYYKNVKDVDNAIELHFVNEIIPGYFWIFPLEKNCANVGIGMVIKEYQKKKWKMTDKMFEIIAHNPLFKERFKEAQLDEKTVKAWTLPVGSKRRKSHGNGFVLVGDAAGLIDPFTGEGISNSMKSGELAAEWIDKALTAGDVSGTFLRQYADAVWDALGDRLRTSHKLQKLGRNKSLVNLVVNKASKSRQIQDALREIMDNSEQRGKLANPLFYLKLLLS
jgi:geranylgeranyl reductase family protein